MSASKLNEMVELLKQRSITTKSAPFSTSVIRALQKEVEFWLFTTQSLLAQEEAEKKEHLSHPCKCEHQYPDGNCHQKCRVCNPEDMPCPLKESSLDGNNPTTYEQWRNTLTEEQRLASDREFAKCVEEHCKPTAPASLVEELRYIEKTMRFESIKFPDVGRLNVANTLKELLSHYKPEPKVADGGLIGELQDFVEFLKRDYKAQKGGAKDAVKWILNKAQYIISHYTPQESLAELADRKGYDTSFVRLDPDNIMVELTHQDCSTTEKDWAETEHKSISSCEQSAREYLNSLPDKENLK